MSLVAVLALASVEPLSAQRPEADDPLPPGAIQRLGTTRWRCTGTVQCAAFSPDGKLFAVACDDGVVRLWDAATGRELHTFDQSAATCLAFSPDGKTLALPGRRDRWVTLHDVATGKEVRAFMPPDDGLPALVFSLAFAPDGNTLVCGTAGDPNHAHVPARLRPQLRRFFESTKRPALVKAWDVATGKPLWDVAADQYAILHVGFSPDGAYLATGSRWYLTVFDAATRKTLHTRDCLPGHFTFDATGTTLCYRAKDQGEEAVALLHIPDGKDIALRRTPLGATVAAAAGRLLHINRVGPRHVWDLVADEKFCTLAGLRAPEFSHDSTPEVFPLALTADGKTLAVGVGRAYYRETTVVLFDTATGRELRPQPGHREGVASLAISGDGKVVVSAGTEETVCVWDRDTGRLLHSLRHPLRHLIVSLSGDGTRLAAAGGNEVLVWATATGKEVTRWRVTDGPAPRRHLSQGLFAPDGRTYVTAEAWATASVWDVAGGKRRFLFRQPAGDIYEVALAPDGLLAATAGVGGVDLWDVATGKPVRNLGLYYGNSWALAFAPNGRHLAVANGAQVSVIDLHTDRTVCTATAAATVKALAFSPDGWMLAAGLAWPENRVQVWEVATGGERRQMIGHRHEVTAVAFLPGGAALASGSLDNTVLVWSLYGETPLRAPRQLAHKELEMHWAALESGRDAARAFDALCALATNPEGVPAFLAGRLVPLGPPDHQQIAQWIADLDAPRFATRERAQRALQGLRWQPASALKKALAGQTTPEARRRMQSLLDSLDEQAALAAYIRHARVLEVLEHQGTAEARQLLAALTHGSLPPRLTWAAEEALARLAAAAGK
jgi:WD40 repeat protein